MISGGLEGCSPLAVGESVASNKSARMGVNNRRLFPLPVQREVTPVTNRESVPS